MHLLSKDLSFKRGGAKLASCPGRHLTSLRPLVLLHSVRQRVIDQVLLFREQQTAKLALEEALVRVGGEVEYEVGRGRKHRLALVARIRSRLPVRRMLGGHVPGQLPVPAGRGMAQFGRRVGQGLCLAVKERRSRVGFYQVSGTRRRQTAAPVCVTAAEHARVAALVDPAALA